MVPEKVPDTSVLKNAAEKIKDSSKEIVKGINKNGIYNDTEYHTLKGNAVKSPRPIDEQHALDNSFRLDANTKRRIAVSHGQFVVIDETSPGLYHGHVREWNQLRDEMKAVLRKADLVTKKGKIK